MSSASNKFISNREVAPVIDCGVFENESNSRFAIGVYSPEDVLNYDSNPILKAYLQLRANVYIDQTKMLEDSYKRIDGTEIDENDERSAHFVVLENMMGKAAIFACMRLIEKTRENDAILPIEEFFPEIPLFSNPAPVSSVEVSRFIVRHENPSSNMQAKKQLINTGMAHLSTKDLGPVYAVVEPEFERSIKMARVSTNRIAEPKIVPEYNDVNLGIEIDRLAFESRVGKEALMALHLNAGEYRYWGSINQED